MISRIVVLWAQIQPLTTVGLIQSVEEVSPLLLDYFEHRL